MFSWYKDLIVDLVFSHLGFGSGNLFLIALFPDLCLLVLVWIVYVQVNSYGHIVTLVHYCWTSNEHLFE